MKLRNHHLAVLVACTTVLACGRSSDKAEVFADPTESMEQAVWANNGFENDANNSVPSSWTLSNYLNAGISGSDAAPPSSVSQLNLGTAGAGTNETLVVGTATMQQTDPDLGSGQAFRYPRFGQRSARINYLSPTTNGKNKNVNMLRQTMTVGQADVDPTDGQIHVRVVLAPVLENPAHGFTQQPYFYVELTNTTRNSSLYQTFNLAGQQSAPWNNTVSLNTNNATQWQDWQMLDILATPGTLSVGEQVQLTVVASGCSLGGHFGRVYLDGVGASVPGPYTWATAPQLTRAGAQLTYMVNYSNGDSTPAIGASINIDTPANATFASTSLASCTVPAVGSGGTLVCPLGTIQPGGTGSFTVTVNVSSSATSNVKSGTYSINAVNGSRLIGPAVNTPIVPASTTFADVVVSPVTTVTAANWGSPISYSFKVANQGPTDLPAGNLMVNDAMPPQFTNVTWTCALTAGSSSTSSCGAVSGTGYIATHPKLASGGEVTYTVNATVASGSGNATVSHDPNAAVVSGSSDPNTYNNDALMVTTLGTPDSLTLTKTNPTYGKVATYPNVLSCDSSCVTTSGLAADGTSVQLNAIVQNGGVFAGWGGACAGAGNSTTCSVAMNGNQAVYANFGPPPTPGAASAIYIYSGNNQYGRIGTAYPASAQAFVADANGTPVPNVAVTFTPPAAGATLNPNTATIISTDANGLATLALNANGTVGPFSLTAAATGVGSSVTYALTNVGSPNSLIYIVGGNATTAQSVVVNSNFTTNPTVRVLDANNNPVPGATVTWAANGNATTNANAILTTSTSVSNAQGYAAIGVRANGSVGPYTLSATIAGLNTVTFNLANTAATAAAIRVVSGTPQTTPTAGTFNLPLTIQVSDNVGNPVPGSTVTWTVPTTGASATLSTTTITTDATGQGNVIATANATAGNYNVTAAAGGVTATAVFALTNDGLQYVTVQSGGNQSTAVNSAFAPITALVTDRNGNNANNVTVTFTAPTTGARATFTGNVSTITATTDANGIATVTPTAGSATGSYKVTASVSAASTAATYNLTNTAGAATSIAVSTGNTAQSAVVGNPFATALAAQVNDANGNGVPGVTVTFTTPAGNPNAVLSSSTAVTDSTGKASITATAGNIVGTYNVTAAGSGVSGTVTFGALTNTVGAAAQVSILSGNYQSAAINTNTTLPLKVIVTDAYGNPVANSNVVWNSNNPNMGVAFASSLTDTSGNANTTVSAKGTTGAYNITGTVTGLTPVTFSLGTTAVDPNGLTIVSGTPQSVAVNTAFGQPLVVKVQGAGNPNLANVWVTWSGPSSGATINPISLSGITNPNGIATVTATAGSVASSTAYAVAALASKYSGNANFLLTNTTGTTGTVKLLSGTGQSTQVATAFATSVNARVVDSGGNPIANSNVTFAAQGTATTANASVASQIVVTDAAGNANATFAANNYSGNFNVIVTSAAGGSATFTMTNTPAAANKVVVSTGSSQSAVVNSVFGSALTALVTDTYGNPVGSGTTVTFTNPSTNPNAIPNSATAVTNSSGRASISARAGLVTGSYNIVASISGGTSTASFALTNTAGPASGVAVSSGGTQSQNVNNTFASPLVAQVVDAYGNAVPAVFTVNFSAPTGAGVATAGLPGALAQNVNITTDGTGLATVTANANTVAGSYAVVVRVGSSSNTASFNLTNLPGAAAKVSVSSGNNQSKTVATAFTNPLAVSVTDIYNNLVGAGTTVTFTNPSTGNANATLPGGGVTATASTNASGVASLSATAGQVVGSYSVTATVPSGSQSASFSLTNQLGAPAKVVLVSGSPQNQNVNGAFGAPLVAQVTDAYGNVVGAGISVSLSPSPSAATASFSPASPSTDSSGKISVTATAGSIAGAAYTVTASVPSGTQSASFSLTNLPGTPAKVNVVSGSPQSQNANAVFGSPLVAQVLDANNNVVGAGYTVNFSAPTPGTGVATAVVAASATTNASGQVSLPVTAGTVAGGPYNVTASVTGGSVTATFALTNTAGAAAAVAVVSGDPQSKAVGQAFDANIVVQVNDAYGNAVGANVPVTYTAPSSGASATLGSAGNANTTSNGRVSLPATAGTVAGSYTVSAAVAGGTSSAIFHLTNLLGTLTHVSVVSGSGQTMAVGAAFANLVAQVSDDYGNPAGAGTTVSFATPAEPNATLLATSGSTTSSGQASIGATAGHIAGNYNIIATISGGTTSAYFALTNAPGTAATVAVVSGDLQSQAVTQAFGNPLVALVSDTYGNAVGASVTVNWTVPSTDPSASLSASSGPTDANGKASVTATAGKRSGTYNVTAAVTGAGTQATFHLTNQPGVAALVSTGTGSSPQSTPANANFTNPLVALVTDSQGNPVPGVTVTYGPPASGATASLSALTGVSDANGLVSVTANANTVAGTYAVTASVPGVTAPASFALTNTPGAASALAVVQGNDQNTTVNTAFAAVVAQVTDAYNNRVPNATISVQPPASGATASLSGTPAATDANGRTTLTLNANTVAGSYTVNLSTSGVTPATALRLSNVPGAAAKVAVASGNNQHGTVGTAFATALGVTVTDAYGNPVPNVAVTLTVPSTDPTAAQSASPAATDASGNTSVSLTAGTKPGIYTVSISAAGVTTPASFTLTNDVGAVATVTTSSGDGQSATVHSSFAAPLVVVAADSYGNPVANANITFTAPGSGAGLSPTTTVLATDANGKASLPAVANDVAGAYSVSAAAAVGSTASFSLTNNPGPIATLTPLNSSSPQSTQVGSAFSTTLVMQVADSYGNPLSGVTVAIAAPGTGASATLASVSNNGVTDAQGQISVTATANTVLGTYSVTATPSVGSVTGAWTLSNTAAPASNLVVRTGDNQSVGVNSALNAPLVAKVTDTYGNPVSGVSVTFTVFSTSGATLTPAATTYTTNDGGLVGLTGTANGTVGSYQVIGAATGVTPTANFTVNNVANGGLSFSKVSGDNQSAQVTTSFAQPLVMEVHDAANNPIGGVLVTFSGTNASLSATALSTDGNGLVSLNVGALSTAGAVQVTASLNSSTQSTFNLMATPGPVVALQADAVSGTQSASEGQAFTQPLGVTAVDAWGNPVAGTSVTFAAPSSGATAQLSGTTVSTDPNGHAQIVATAGMVAGSYPVTATLAGSGTATASYTLTNLAGSPSVFHIVSGDNANTVVHTAFSQPFQVQLLDSNGAPLAGVAVTFSAPASGATATPGATVTTTDAQGYAQLQATAGDVAGAYTVTASAIGASAPAVLHVSNLPGTAVALVPDPVSSSQSALPGNGFVNPLGVTVVDAYGNPVPGATVTYTVPATGATAQLTSLTATTDASGHAQVTGTAGSTTGSYQVTAQVAGVSTPATWSLTNSTDTPLIVLSASNISQSTKVNTAFQPLVIYVHDAFGGPVPNAEVDFSGPSSGAGASFVGSLISDANGLVSLPITANKFAGSYTVSATVPNGSTPLVFNLTNTPNPPSQLILSTISTPQSAVVGHPFAVNLQVRVLDPNGNPVVGAVVTFTPPSSGPTVQLSATAVVTDAQGYAQVVAIAGNTAGLVSVGISVDNTNLTANVQLTNVSAAPDTLTLQSGGGQNAVAGQAFASPLVFRLLDSSNTAHSGVLVTFSSAPDGLVLGAAHATTDASGLASVNATAGPASGTFTVTATAPNTAAPATATLTVGGIPTTTTLTLSKADLDPGEAVQLSAQVSVTGGTSGTPAGKVNFFIDNNRVATAPCDSAGKATASYGAGAPGAHNATAVFVPDAPYAASQSAPSPFKVTDWVISGGGCAALAGGGGGGALLVLAGLARWLRRRRR